jgi:hypothetical protein
VNVIIFRWILTLSDGLIKSISEININKNTNNNNIK